MSTKYDYTVLIDGVDATAVFNKMGGPAAAQRFLAGELSLVEVVKEPKVFLRRLETIPLSYNDRRDDYLTAAEVFKAGFDSDFENWGIIFSGIAPAVNVDVDELVLDGKYSNFLGNTAEELEKRRFLGSQFVALCRVYPHKLRKEGRANFVVLTKNDEPVLPDLSNVFVAYVFVYDDGELLAYLDRFSHGIVWRGERRHQVFSPQQVA